MTMNWPKYVEILFENRWKERELILAFCNRQLARLLGCQQWSVYSAARVAQRKHYDINSIASQRER